MKDSSLVIWIRRLIYSSTLVPLIILSQYISPFHFGKVVILRAIVEVMLGLYLLLIWRDRSYLPKFTGITWAFFAFTLAFTLTTFTGVAFLQSFWGTLERMGGLFTFWHYFVFYLITISVLRTRQDWQTLLDLVVCVGLVSALYGFLQRFSIGFILGSGGRERIFGTIGNPALFAGYQILVAYLAATLCFTRQIGPMAGVPRDSASSGAKYIGFGLAAMIVMALLSGSLQWMDGTWVVPLGLVAYGTYLFVAESLGWGRAFYAAVAGLTALAAALTVVRGSLVAMVVATMVFVLLYTIYYQSHRARNILLAGITGVVLFVFFAMAFRTTSFVQNSSYLKRITDFSFTNATVETRFWAWSAGLKGFSENPKTVLVGWGPENFNVPFSKYFNPKFFTGPGSETFFDRAHNMFVEILVTTGLAGELTYLSIFATTFWALWKMLKRQGDERILGIGLISLTVAYIIHNSFIFDTSANFLTFFMILAFITYLAKGGLSEAVAPVAVAAKKGQSLPPRKPWTALQSTVAIFLAVGVFTSVYATSIKMTWANYASTRAIIAGWQGDFVGAVAKYRQAIDANVPGRYEYRTKYSEYLLQISSSANIDQVPNFEQLVLTNIEDVKHNIQENPMDYLPYLYISRLYLTLGKSNPSSPYNQKALEYSGKALEISPTFVRTYYEVAQAYLNMKDYDKAFAAFAKASELNPDVGLTYWYMAVVNFTRGHDQEALALVQKATAHGYILSESDAQKMINMYLAKKDFPGVVTMFEQLTMASPSNPQYWASLAAAYVKVNRIPDAITAVRKAIAAAPNDSAFIEQANAYLRQLGAQP